MNSFKEFLKFVWLKLRTDRLAQIMALSVTVSSIDVYLLRTPSAFIGALFAWVVWTITLVVHAVRSGHRRKKYREDIKRLDWFEGEARRLAFDLAKLPQGSEEFDRTFQQFVEATKRFSYEVNSIFGPPKIRSRIL